MKVLIINPIMYTSEKPKIQRVNSIKDTMCYDLCLAFCELGHEVTLIGGEPYKPLECEKYPFQIVWMRCSNWKLFMHNCFPYIGNIRIWSYGYTSNRRIRP